MRREPRWSQNGGRPVSHAVAASVALAHAARALVVPKRTRPPRPCAAGLGGPKVQEAPSPMRQGPRWTQSGRGPLAHAAKASVVPKRRRPSGPCGVGVGGEQTVEAPSPMRRGPRWSQN